MSRCVLAGPFPNVPARAASALPASSPLRPQVGPPAEKGEGRARRGFVCPEKLAARPAQENASNIKVLADILPRSIGLYGDENALGWRDVIGTVSEDKEVVKVVGGKKVTETKTWTYFELSDYH